MAEPVTIQASNGKTNYITSIKAKEFTIPLDEPISIGGSGTAPAPFDYLYSALAGCVAVTLRMYVERKGWNVGQIYVNVTPSKNESGETVLIKKLAFEHEISVDQEKRLLVIADKCPVSKLLHNGVAMRTEL